MFFKYFFIFLFGIISLYAGSQNVEVLAKKVTKKVDIIHAVDDVVIYSKDYVITADEAYYNTNTSDIELIGNVTMLRGVNFATRSGHISMNLKKDIGDLTPMFAYTGDSKLWLKCDNASFDPEYYLTTKSVVSSCNVQNPDWKIGFTSGKYDRKNQFLGMYNALFYIKDTPIFYLPYFSFPTDKTRRSGFLRPRLSLSSGEGLYYLQPLYFAPQLNWDFQVDTQIRTNRGYGVHGTFRYIDSPYSNLEVSLGKFKEKSNYVTKHNLKNNSHYGYSIAYERSKLLSLIYPNLEDGLWLDFKYLNDIDYFNTINNSGISYNKLVQSTFNYYIKRDLDYFGLYAKYYINTSKVSNKGTLQEIPTFQYHRFTNTILSDKLFYSLDYKTTNYTRNENDNASLNEINLPITFYTPFFNDFLHFKFTENIYLAKSYSYNTVSSVKNAEFTKNFHRISLYTELVKPYNDFLHTLYLGADYTIPSLNRKSGYFPSFIVLNSEEKNLGLNLIEYFYSNSGEKLVSHTMRQSLFFSDTKYKYGDLENDLKLYFSKDATLSNLLKYSHQYSRISKFQTSLNFKINDYGVYFIHTYEEDANDNKKNYLTLNINSDYVKNYNIFASTNYDIRDNYFKSWSIGLKYKKRCWDYIITYKEDRTPKLTSSGSDSVNKKGIYLLFNLYPLGSVNYNFTQENKVISK